MNRYLFIGPSLPDAAARTGPDIVALPPVAAGDLLRLNAKPGDVVGIADGYFHQTRAVRHKEILHLLDTGVTVLGAASMGALRAAELDRFGMGGVGRIYRAYRRGDLTADDEVTLLHGFAEDGYPAGSEPLVNLRATLDLAVREGLLGVAAANRLVASLSRRPYRLRTYRDALQLASEQHVPDLEGLRELFATRPANPKRDDAIRLLGVMRRLTGTPSAPRTLSAPTVYLHRWQLGARSLDTPDGPVAEMAVLRACQLFATDYPAFQRDLVMDALTRECAETCDRDAETDPAWAHARHRDVLPDSDSPAALEFLDPWLTAAEREGLSARDRCAAFLVRSFQIAPGIPADGLALDRLRTRPAALAAARIVTAAARMNEAVRRRREAFDIHALSTGRIIEYTAGRWGVDPQDLELHALDRGIPSLDTLVAAARPYYMLAKYNPELVDLAVLGP